MRPTLIIALLLALIGAPSFAQTDAFDSGEKADFQGGFSNNAGLQNTQTETFLRVEEAYQLSTEVQTGQLSLLWAIAPKYYLYKDRFKLKAFVDDAYVPVDAQYETGIVKYDEYFAKELEVFYGDTEILAATTGLPNEFVLKVTSQGCADAGLCYPPQHEYFDVNLQAATITLGSKPQTTQTSAKNTEGDNSENTEETWLPLILLLAIAGGAILNLMPCVFPVLSIKALSIAGAKEDHKAHGWAYTAGAVGAFVLVAALMLIARAGGEAVGWGFQLQSPVLVGLLAYLFFAMGLSLSGLTEFGTGFMGAGQNLTSGGGLKGSFFTGVLAAVVASPCTAPFMGTALGYALTQPAHISLMVFGALGFGMALPFLLISYVPKLSEYLPKPGAWMDTFKQVLAFPLYLAAVWLLWVLGRQAGSDNMALLVIGAILIAFGLWLHRRSQGWTGKSLATIAGIAALSLPFNLMPHSASDSQDEGRWKAYKQATFSEQRELGQAIFINLTADWCITCLANEKVVLGTDTTEALFDRLNVLTLKGDWTNYNAEITELLNEHGRSGVPLYLVFPASGKGKPRILPQILSQDVLSEALEQAAAS